MNLNAIEKPKEVKEPKPVVESEQKIDCEKTTAQEDDIVEVFENPERSTSRRSEKTLSEPIAEGSIRNFFPKNK